MNKFEGLVKLALENISKPVGTYKHFSFILRKNKVVAFGYNNVLKTHPFALKHGYAFPYVHSELAAIIKYPEPLTTLSHCVMINVRLTKTNKVTLSRPCGNCQRLLIACGFKEVLYSNEFGLFERFAF